MTTGVVEHKDKSAEPSGYAVNHRAYDKQIKDVWLLEGNSHGWLWGIAICIKCHGTGLAEVVD